MTDSFKGGDHHPHGPPQASLDGAPVLFQDIPECTEHHSALLPVLSTPVPESRDQPVQHGCHRRRSRPRKSQVSLKIESSESPEICEFSQKGHVSLKKI